MATHVWALEDGSSRPAIQPLERAREADGPSSASSSPDGSGWRSASGAELSRMRFAGGLSWRRSGEPARRNVARVRADSLHSSHWIGRMSGRVLSSVV
jgi:hypothetical protein